MFFIGQNLKNVRSHGIFFSWTFDFLLFKEILNVIINFMENQSWNTNHELVSDIDVEKTWFLM